MPLYNREFETVTNANTIAQWVDAYNNNALAGSDIVFMMGEATFSSVLYTGLETVGNGVNTYKMEAFKDVAPDFNAVFPSNLVLDNWYVYFRNINKFIFVSQLHVDLTDYSKYDNDEYVQGDLYHFFLNYKLGYRISHSPIPKYGEARLFRFIASSSNFEQLIPTFPRYFYAGDNTDFVKVTGMDVVPADAVTLGIDDGFVTYDGISFDTHATPDKKYYIDDMIDGVSIVAAGCGYMVGDVIGTNVAETNFRITEVKNEYTEGDVWNPDIVYEKDWEVYWNGHFWTAAQETQTEPKDGNAEWIKGSAAGSIVDGEQTEDPVEVQFDGTGGAISISTRVTPWNILYNTSENKLDYKSVTKSVDGSQIMDYTNNRMENLPANKFTIQRIHLDYLKDLLVIQYGNMAFDTMRSALDAIYSLSFPFVYNTYIFPVLAYMVVRSDYTDLTDPEQCQIVQVHTSSTDIRETENLATDSYARAILEQHTQQIQALNDWLTRLQDQVDTLENNFNLHISNNLPSPSNIKQGSNQNPHRVTKAEVGLGNVDNVAMKDMPVPSTGGSSGLVHVREAIDAALSEGKSYTDRSTAALLAKCNQQFLFKDRDDSTGSGVKTVINDLRTRAKCMKFQCNGYNDNSGYNWYVGELPANPPTESYGVKKSND